jgi:hypothetical protein
MLCIVFGLHIMFDKLLSSDNAISVGVIVTGLAIISSCGMFYSLFRTPKHICDKCEGTGELEVKCEPCKECGRSD